jgi:alpha-L-fucosidase
VDVLITTERENVEIYYTLDGTDPDKRSRSVSGGVTLTETGLVTAQNFRDGRPVSGTTRALFTKVAPHPGVKVKKAERGLHYAYYEGSWDSLPDFDKLTKAKTGVISNIDISDRARDNLFGFVFEGFILIQEKGVYSFYTDSDDGSQLLVDDKLVVDNDGLHSMTEVLGSIALDVGHHPIRVTYFEKSGANQLDVYYESASFEKQSIPDNLLFHKK